MFKKEIGYIIPNLKINGKDAPYGVLNEKSIRISAMIMFFVGLIIFIYTLITRDLFLFTIGVPIYSLLFFINISVGPKYSPLGIFSSYIVKNKEKEWVGAKQKRFAWILGFIMSIIVLSLVFIFDIRGLIPIFLCGICLILMFLEAFFGYCVGCTIYIYLRDKGYIKKEEFAPVCAGGVCEIK